MAKKPRSEWPKYTCPAIDNALSRINQAVDAVEELRSSNETLREWAEYWEEKHNEVKDEAAEVESALEKRIEQLEGEIAELKSGVAVTP